MDDPPEPSNGQPADSDAAIAPTRDATAVGDPADRPRPAGLRSYRARRRAKKALRSKLRRRLARAGVAVALLVVVVVGASIGYTLYRFHQVRHIPGGKDVIGAPKAGAPENILLIGSTNRCAATELKVFKQECADGVTGINSDIVMIVRIEPSSNRVVLLSIPRDTFVPDARAGGLYNRIDAALADGPAQLADAITQDYGIPINHFIELNFGSFDDVVGTLGGVDMYFPDRLYDGDQPPLDITHTGCLHVTGYTALALVRARTLYYFTRGETMNYAAMNAAEASGDPTPDSGGHYDGTGDLGRITRVHLFLRVLASAVAERGLGDVTTDNALIGAIAPELVVDDKLGDLEMLHLAREIDHADIGTARELTTPIVNDAATYYYKGYDYEDVIFPTEPQDQKTIDQFMGTTPRGLKLSPSTISVSVVDGTDSTSATAETAAGLHALGYPIVPTNATNYVGPVSETSVVYAPGHLQEAERVMASLRGTVVMAEGTPANGAKISVVAGSDLAVEAARSPAASTTTPTTRPAPPTTTAASTGSTAASTTTTSPATTAPNSTAAAPNPDLGVPTSSDPAVAPWDPRACPVKSTPVKSTR